jgi:glutamine cyclotransferase
MWCSVFGRAHETGRDMSDMSCHDMSERRHGHIEGDVHDGVHGEPPKRRRGATRVGTIMLACAAVLVPAACGGGSGPATLPPVTTAAPVDRGTTSTVPASSPTTAPSATTRPPGTPVDRLRVQVVERRPHDKTSFTEGLVLDGDTVYESSGLYGSSSLRVVDAQTGAVRRSVALPSAYFAEGLAKVGSRLVQLTWREHVALVYDIATMQVVERHAYDGEGWGLCDDNARLVMSDGTETLSFRDRDSFRLLGSVRVTLDGQPVKNLNELECVNGSVYANVWLTDQIMRIDPTTGAVTAVIDASGLLAANERGGPDDVLNGIAYDAAHDTFLLTGKHWPALFETRFVATG